MIALDENIVHDQRTLLKKWRISFKQIGVDFARKGLKDINGILPLLHSLTNPTFFTRDSDFYNKSLTHKKYCLVLMDVNKNQVAEYIRRFLRHPQFKTKAKRLGRVVRVSQAGLHYWQLNVDIEQFVVWE